MPRSKTEKSLLRLLGIGCLFIAPAVCFAPATVPSLAPQVTSVFPRGGRVGSSFDIRMSGTNLDRADRIDFAASGIHAHITSSGARQILAGIQIDSRAETGPVEFRVLTPTGTTVGAFVIGSLPELQEAEPNDRPETSQHIEYPIVINGTAGPEDADLFRFDVHAGQTLAFDVSAARNGSPLDPVLAVLDQHGREIAYCDDYYIEKDAHLEYTFSREGTYFVRVTASYSRSSPGADYRLTVTDRAYPMYSIPAGAQRGNNVALTIRGANLNTIDQAWLDESAVPSKVLGRSTEGFKIAITIPADALPGAHRLHLGSTSEEAANSLRFEVSESKEMTIEDSAAADHGHPVLVAPPVVINSEIAERDNDYLHRAHVYDLDAPENGRYEFQVKAWDLGLRTDPVVTLFDPEGKKVAMEDDPAPNSFIHYASSHDPDLVYRFPKAGRYRVVVRDAMYRGGPGFIYRMTIRPTQPDFSVAVLRSQITAYVGRKATLPANVHRTGGVHVIEMFKLPDNEIENFRIREIDGWQAAVILRVDGTPPGVTAEPVLAEPRNTTFKGNDGEDLFVDGTVIDLPLQIGQEVQPGTYKIHVKAQSSFDGRNVTREGRVFRKNRLLKIPEAEQTDIYLTIVKPPAVLLTGPEHVEISKGETGHLKLNLFQFEQSSGSILVEARTKVTGLNTGTVTVPRDGEELEVPVSADTDAKDSNEVIMVARDAVSGRILGQSAPIRVRTSNRTPN